MPDICTKCNRMLGRERPLPDGTSAVRCKWCHLDEVEVFWRDLSTADPLKIIRYVSTLKFMAASFTGLAQRYRDSWADFDGRTFQKEVAEILAEAASFLSKETEE